MTTSTEEEIKDHDITYNKPDTIDTFIKPDTIDTPTYEKPNAYDDLTTPITPTPQEIDELAMKLENTSQLEAIHRTEEEDGEGPILNTIVRYNTRKAKMAPPPSQDSNKVTSSLLSKIQSTTTATTTITTNIDESDIIFPTTQSPNSSSILLSPTSISHMNNNYSNSNLSVDSNGISPSISNSTIDSLNSTSSSTTTSKQMLLDSLKRRSSKDVVQYDIRKVSLVQPHHHEIYIGGTKKLIYRKRQPHSYSWGFQNVLYKTMMDQHYENSDQYTKYGIKIAEARRRAFQKDITIEWGLDESNSSSNINNDSNIDLIQDDDDDINSQGSQDTNNNTEKKPRCRKFLNVNNSHLLFVYETLYDTNYCLRWKRPSLVSHDMICEIRKLDEDEKIEENHNQDNSSCSSNNNNKSHHKKKKKKWQLLAEFDSHGMGYLINVGKLTMDLRGLALVERPDHLESHLLITCCTLVDLMREVVQKAVGLSNGGVASSN